ncbi:oligomeric complex COG6 [Suillus hirtellus]|nr:oligomeric complex COG6 [Suillus hirtellus]
MSVQARSPVPPPSSLSVPSRNAGTPVSASQTRNPITIRLRKILGTNFTDEATTEALQTLSELYGTQSTVSVSDSKAQTNGTDSDDNWSDEDVDVGLAVQDDSACLNETASRARKNLRRDLENKLAQGSQQFLQAFSEVDQKLDDLQNHVAAMRVACDEAETQLRLSNEASQSLLDRAESLRSEREEVEARKSIVMLFLNRFTLNDEEAEAITSRDVPIGPRFFEAMNKTERIRNDCRVLMSGEDGPTKAGLDIMASTSSYLEQGYEKIYRWCSFQFRQMGRDAQLEVDSTMQQAIFRLSQRPELLSEALTFLTQTRQTGLLSAFLDALTRGGPSGLPRPIELHAHDPIRYVGDMLAWVHQAIAAECEFLESLFGLGGQNDDGRARRMVGAVRTFKGSEEEGWVKELLNSAVTKLCVPLKVRVLQTVRSQESSIVSYKVANLLQYYMLTMRRTIGEDALLSMTLSEITDVSYKVFFDAIEAHGRALLRIPLDSDDPSLTPPLPILEHAQLLREIMQVYDSSLLDDTTAEPGQTFNRILDVMLDPAMEMCAAAAEEKARYRPQWDRAVFVLNCWCYLQNVLEAFEFTSEKRHTIQEKIDERVKSLEDEHYENILRDASLYDTVTIIKSKPPSDPLSHVLPAQKLQPTLARFSLWLSSPEVVHSPRLSALTSPSLHSTIHRVSLARVTKAYAQLCEEVRKPENRYEAASTLLGMERPFGQAGVLWAIFGLEEEGEESAAD